MVLASLLPSGLLSRTDESIRRELKPVIEVWPSKTADPLLH